MSHTTTVPRSDERAPSRQAVTRRMPLGPDIVITDAAPATLPRTARPLGDTATDLVGRPVRLVARDSGEYLFVGVHGSVTPCLQPPAEIALDPGDICFYDAHQPTSLDFPDVFRAKVFLVPRTSLGLAEPVLHGLNRSPVTRGSRLGALLSPFLSGLADTAAHREPTVGETLVRDAVNLLATAAAEQLDGEEPESCGAELTLLPRILDHIDVHLTDAELSPERIAEANHISVRYLHKLFQEQDLTVSRWIQRRRLEECRRELRRRGGSQPTIAAVAGRWGFISAPHFSRVFRAAYGMSPSEWRDTSGRGAGTVEG
ncbi:helix-turn-helix domain-containing protein [Streptomyces sp. 35G-GA-8]|uniref:helix-turn-helix domain-containing protein n=1 Tax=Streptomyces sp. 35G-GA-8 TaxID=2939434 RepID=UPI00201EBF1A|nr:helix-turn-helix domain-containing protein [Streptomyces sp. 35G-GA-8]MCL7376908.1 helix-turn-helix domain-containing protein [Streptomyces sp. 35G-GA-8]